MKRLMVYAMVTLAFLAVALALAGCVSGGGGGGYTGVSKDVACANAWAQADVKPEDANWFVSEVLNRDWPPDSVGAAVKECIQDGWDGWRT